MKEYLEKIGVASFEEGYRLLREQAALVDGSTFGILKVSGDNAAASLDALATKDIQYLNIDTVSECLILNELNGSAGETLYYTDKKAQVGVVYTYRIIPINAELLNNGVLLEGKQAVQIAQAKAPSAGSRLWQDITGLFAGSSPSGDDAADALSLFWQSGD